MNSKSDYECYTCCKHNIEFRALVIYPNINHKYENKP